MSRLPSEWFRSGVPGAFAVGGGVVDELLEVGGVAFLVAFGPCHDQAVNPGVMIGEGGVGEVVGASGDCCFEFGVRAVAPLPESGEGFVVFDFGVDCVDSFDDPLQVGADELTVFGVVAFDPEGVSLLVERLQVGFEPADGVEWMRPGGALRRHG